MSKLLVVAAAAALTLATTRVQGACLTDVQAAAMVASFMNRQPAANLEGLSAADGECTRAKVNHYLAQQLGKPVGHKAGLTNPAVQKRFNHDSPTRGMLYAPMLLKDGATVDAKFGARPLFEADMLVRVNDARINQARTPDDVLRAIDQVIPFIELPDLLVETPAKLNGPAINAINVGARLGVLGAPIPVQRSAAFSNALRDMQIVIKIDGAEVDQGRGADVLGHPLNAVIWLAQDLAREGGALKKGDLVSLGSFSKLHPPKPGTAVEIDYRVLPNDPAVRVNFK